MKALVILIFVSSIISCSDNLKAKSRFTGKAMPSFDLMMLDSVTRINTNSFPIGKPIVILYISPSCPFCKAQTKEIISELETFSDIKVCIVSGFPLSDLKQFYYECKLKGHPQIVFGYDVNSSFANYYQVASVPYIAIYDKNKVLKQILNKKTSNNLIREIALN